jgi:group I intron endonuclease
MEKTYTLYILENKKNGKRYVGQTTQPLEKRLSQHKYGDSVISRAIKKYGLDSFDVTSFTAPSLDALNRLEKVLIKELESIAGKNGYNIKRGGKNSLLTPDEKARLRDAWDDERRAKQSRKLKAAWVKKRGQCEVCGKDKTMGYDPDIDFRICPSCRHARHLAQDLGFDKLYGKF